jgi:WD40 repeat protein
MNAMEDQPTVVSSAIIKEAHSLNITAMGFPKVSSDQETKLFSGSRDYSVKVWDVPTTKCVNEYKMSRNIVTSIATSGSHPHTIFQSSEDLTVKLWDYRAPASLPSASITGFVYFALTMDLHESGDYLATGCKGFNSVGCNVFIWDLRKLSKNLNTINYLHSDSPSHDYSGHSQDVTSCKFSKKNSHYLYSVSKDGSLYAWEIKSSSQRISYQFPKKYFTALVLLDPLQILQAGINAVDSEEYLALSAMDGSLSIIKFDFKNLQFDLVRTTLVSLESEEINY